jgi:peptide/nickel transport system substrate-binding protein
MGNLLRILALTLLLAAQSVAQAATPFDVLVVGMRLDDLASLDPAEIYEVSGGEIAGNLYERLVEVEQGEIVPGLAESWAVTPSGQSMIFTLRQGAQFHSGNAVTAEDAAWSLRRVVKLNKGGAFLLKQLGFTSLDVEMKIRVLDARRLEIDLGFDIAPSFLLRCLSSWVGSVLDSKLLKQVEAKGDMGSGWLRANSAGSGPFKLVYWRPGEGVVLGRNANWRQGAPKMKRIVLKHLPEASSQRLMLEKGDIDVARNISPDDLTAIAANPALRLRRIPQGGLVYLGFNQKHAALAKPQVRRALKLLIDYDAIATHVLKGTKGVRQAIIPWGFPSAIESRPYAPDLVQAKRLLAQAGHAEGFALKLDLTAGSPGLEIAQAIQASFAQANIRLELQPSDNRQLLTRYRARAHDIVLAQWSPDFFDPHSNAQGFAWNPDTSENSPFKLLAWRNSWSTPETTRMAQAAKGERDEKRRSALYADIQRRTLEDGPYAVMFQDLSILAERAEVEGIVIGPVFDQVRYAGAAKKAGKPP